MKIRVKFHQFPGDIPKRDKIEMIENRDHRFHGWMLKNIIQPRERAVFKRQTEQLISEYDSE